MKTDLLAFVVILGFGGVVLWFLTRKTAIPYAPTTTRDAACGTGSKVGAAVGTAVANYYGAYGAKVDCKDTGVLDHPEEWEEKGKTYAEGFAGASWEFSKAPFTAVLPESLQFGSSKNCRASNGKDVFPNDMELCKHYFNITNCEDCGRTYDLNSRKWPWEDGYRKSNAAATPNYTQQTPAEPNTASQVPIYFG